MKKRVILCMMCTALAFICGQTAFTVKAQGDNYTEDVHATGYLMEEDEELWAQCIYDDNDGRIGAAAFPEYYITPKLPAVRDQGSYGTCWAHATLALMEINMMKQGYEEQDYSEMHLAYYSYFTQSDPLGGLDGDLKTNGGGYIFLNRGGNFWMATTTLRSWKGAALESLVPHTEESAQQVIQEGISSEYAFLDVAYLKNYYWVNTTEPAAMKQAILDYGALAISYYSSGSYLNYETGAYYCPSKKSVNHSVVIVGWDDNYSASNFKTAPEGDGAWIVRNSWGDDHANDGYFYMSYYENTLSATAMAIEAVPASAYDYNYQYDSTTNTWYHWNTGNKNYLKGANVFTVAAKESEEEILRAVSFGAKGANITYQVTIYKNLTDATNPESGEVISTVSGVTTFAGGYTVDLPQPVYVKAGDTFSVVLEIWSEDGNAVMIAEGTKEYSGDYSIESSAKPGQSFLFIKNWYDFGVKNNKNLCIKAYTTIAEPRVVCPIPGYTGLAQAEDGTWYFFVNGYSDQTYNGLAPLGNDWWMVVEGKIDFSYTGLSFYNNQWLYVECGKYNPAYSGLAFVNDAWWYVVNGKVDFSYSGLIFFNDAWWYVQNGMIDFSYTGLVFFNDTWWYVENGKINFAYNGLAYVNDAWWYVQGGVIDFSYNGLAFYNEKWWYVTGARIDFTYSGGVFFNDAWWYIENGELNFGFTGLVTNENGTWYYQNGMLDFGFSGEVTIDGVQYIIENGKVKNS